MIAGARLASMLAAVAIGGCAMDGELDTDRVEAADSVDQWTAAAPIPGMASSVQVALTTTGSKQLLAFTDASGVVQLSRFTGSGWSPAQPVPGALATADAPAMAWRSGHLLLLYHPRQQNRLVMQTAVEGASWTSPVTAGTSLWDHQLQGGAAVVANGDHWYAAYCTSTSAQVVVQIDKYDGTAWTASRSYAWPITARDDWGCGNLAAGKLSDGRLSITWTLRHTIRALPFERTSWQTYSATSTSSGWPGTPMLTTDTRRAGGISMTTCDGKTHRTRGGLDTAGEIWWTLYDANGQWHPDILMSNRSSPSGAAVGCYDDGHVPEHDRTLMVYDRGDAQLVWSEYGP